jgi:hypothetical protein
MAVHRRDTGPPGRAQGRPVLGPVKHKARSTQDRKRGRPALKGTRIGTPTHIATSATLEHRTNHQNTTTNGYDIALITTDLTATPRKHLRRQIIATRFMPTSPRPATTQEIMEIQQAWAQAAA